MTRRPLHDWTRHYPSASAIAAELRAAPALLGLRTRLLQRDVAERFGCCTVTARTAISFARKVTTRPTGYPQQVAAVARQAGCHG